MPKFHVEIERNAWRSVTLEVEADSGQTAKDLVAASIEDDDPLVEFSIVSDKMVVDNESVWEVMFSERVG